MSPTLVKYLHCSGATVPILINAFNSRMVTLVGTVVPCGSHRFGADNSPMALGAIAGFVLCRPRRKLMICMNEFCLISAQTPVAQSHHWVP